MRRLVLALALLLLPQLPQPAAAQSYAPNYLQPGNNLSDVKNAATALGNLGGMKADGSNATLPAAQNNLQVLPVVADNATLIARTIGSIPANGIIRLDYVVGRGAPAQRFKPETGTCASQASPRVNDGGSCVDLNDGNSVYAVGVTEWNVLEFGCIGNQVTDDHTCLQNAINAAESNNASPNQAGGGLLVVNVPAGKNYCNKASVLSVTSANLTIYSRGYQSPLIQACGADVGILSLTAVRAKIYGLSLDGSKVPGTTQDTVTLGAGCIECDIEENRISDGRYNINSASGEAYIKSNVFSGHYGSAGIYETGGGYIERNKIDSNFPGATPSPKSIAAPSAWASGTPYSTNAIVTLSGYKIQATTGGTSGGSPPTLASFGTAIPDGTVVWKLAGPVGDAAIQVDTGAAAVHAAWNDTTGPYDYNIRVSNTLSGAAPQTVDFDTNTTGNAFVAAFRLDAGFAIRVTGSNDIDNCLETSCYGVYIGAGVTNTVKIDNNRIFQVATGIYAGGGTQINVDGNTISGTGTAVDIAAGLTKFKVNNNDLSGGQWGTNTNTVVVEAGASDYYSIMGNTLGGSPQPSDGGTGTHKTIFGNN